jgi:hypothetical protein
MTTVSLAEIVYGACDLKSKKEKVEWLQRHNSKPLRNILKIMYDKSLKLTIPNEAPPYTPSVSSESHGMLYRETRKLVYFVEGFGGDNLTQVRREALFIQMLETVDRDDARLLIDMIAQKPLKGLTRATIIEAFGDNFITSKSKDDD